MSGEDTLWWCGVGGWSVWCCSSMELLRAPTGAQRASEGAQPLVSKLNRENSCSLGRKQAKNLLMSEQPPEMVEITEEERLVAVTFAKGRYPG